MKGRILALWQEKPEQWLPLDIITMALIASSKDDMLLTESAVKRKLDLLVNEGVLERKRSGFRYLYRKGIY